MPRTPFMRYAFYLASSLKYVSFAEWTSSGRPNPFLRLRRKSRGWTSKRELLQIFDEQGVGWSDRKPRRIVIYDTAA